MSPDILKPIWRSMDVQSPLFTKDEVTSWPAFESLTAIGILRQANTATHVTCDACTEGHVEEVMPVFYENNTRFFIRCPENGRVEISSDRLLQWSVSLDPLLNFVAEAFNATGGIKDPFPSRLWEIGRASIAGRSRMIWVALGLAWPDADTLKPMLPKGKSPLLFILGNMPVDGLVELSPDSMIPCDKVITMDEGSFTMDKDAVADFLNASALNNAKAKKSPKKRAERTANIDLLEKEIIEHIRSARDFAHNAQQQGDEPKLLPRPTQKLLAEKLGMDEATVSRAIHDPNAQKLKLLWDTANDLEAVMKFTIARR
jgi:hypothetical protein